jgi:ParB-like chromosome segregation protein Spo0J
MRHPAMRRAEMEAISAIYAPPGRRPVREEVVGLLADSIRRIGLQVPIAVRTVEEYDIPGEGPTGGVRLLVAGAHRLEVCRRLGWEEVPVVEFADETEARLWEISENLHRAELSALERDEQLAEWVKLVEQKDKRKQEEFSDNLSENQRRGGRPAGGAAAASRELGVNERDVQRALKTASLSDDAKAVARETGLDDNRSALLAAAAKPVEEQAATIREIAERPRPVKGAPNPLRDATKYERREVNNLLRKEPNLSKEQALARVRRREKDRQAKHERERAEADRRRQEQLERLTPVVAEIVTLVRPQAAAMLAALRSEDHWLFVELLEEALVELEAQS